MQISNAEWKIMELLWDKEPRTLTELTKAFKESTGWSKQVINTMLLRMAEKGTVRYEEGKKAKQFFPVVSRSEAEENEADNILDKAFAGSPSLLISAMIRHQKLKKNDIDEICSLLGLTNKEESEEP